MILRASLAIDFVASNAVTLAWKARVAATMSVISTTVVSLLDKRFAQFRTAITGR